MASRKLIFRNITPKARSAPKANPLNRTGPIKIQTYNSPLIQPTKKPVNRLSRFIKNQPVRAQSNSKPMHPKSAPHKRRASVASSVKFSVVGNNSHNRRFSANFLTIPVVSKSAYRTRKGFIPDLPEKENQDAFFKCSNIGAENDIFLFGVCDGHGFYGRQVSSFVKKRLPSLLAQDSLLSVNIKHSLSRCIQNCNTELRELNFDTNFSGTTLIIVLIKGKTLWCANVGDSRAVIARQLNEANRHWKAIALSRDHKPDLKQEQARILKQGGRVQSYYDQEGAPVGPARVWLADDDIPGLAMSRSLGDNVAASVGVIPVPEILEFQLTQQDKFIVLGSDGIFQFISNQEVLEITIPYWKRDQVEGAVEALEQEAVSRWQKNEEVIDDITSFCIFLDI